MYDGYVMGTGDHVRRDCGGGKGTVRALPQDAEVEGQGAAYQERL